jgi:DNA-directed RNA polymerase subunit RPC12/RpoP
MSSSEKRFFPCPICSDRLDVRESKKGKPYVICDRCGVQMFVRNDAGIRELERLTAAPDQVNAWTRLVDLQKRFQKTCPQCRKKFWITEESIVASWFDGRFTGYRCPDPACEGIVEPATDQ